MSISYRTRIPVVLLATIAALLMSVASAHAVTFGLGTFATDITTSRPGGLSPADGTTLAYPNNPISLGWSDVPGAGQYQVQIARVLTAGASCGTSTAFQADNIIVSATTGESAWVPSLLDDANGGALWTGTYCWRVRAVGAPNGIWSAAYKFNRTWDASPGNLKFYNDTDGAIPRAPSAPDFATGSTVTRNSGYLAWDRVAGAASYDVQISSSQSFSPGSLVLTREGITDARMSLIHLPDDTYFWRIRATSPNGTQGPWSAGDSTFTVQWLDPTWSSDARTFPADSSATSDFRIGWTPMPGAAYYQYEIATSAGCFWNPDVPALAPAPYGKWVTYPAKYDASENLEWTADPQPTQCRISDVNATTMNNWITLNDGVGKDVWANINTPCKDDQGKVLCEPARLPDSVPDTYPGYKGSLETAGASGPYPLGDGSQGDAYHLYWRVRPVYRLTQASENTYDVKSDAALLAYGSWTLYQGNGQNRHHAFDWNPAVAPFDSVGTRCADAAQNPGGQCVVNVGSTMQADQAAGVASDASMQFPVLTWKPFQNVDGYIVQLARDPLFNNIAKTEVVPGPTQSSWVPTSSFPDNSQGTGYWWRVQPCRADLEGRCMPIYGDSSAGLPASYGLPGGYDDMAVAQTFTKQVNIQTDVVPNFEGAAPLLKWTRAGIAPSDYTGWNRGIEGADHYELQIARDPAFGKDPITITTTAPRIVPTKPGDSGKATQIADGIWYFRVRAIDRDGLVGSWSQTASFNKRVAAPELDPATAGALAGDGVTVRWSPVPGATSYTVQWSGSDAFDSGVQSGSTLQTSFRIPAAPAGAYFWRVQAVNGGVEGQWSARGGAVTIVAPTRIQIGLNKNTIIAGTKVKIYGELDVAGAPTNGMTVLLQQKPSGCGGSGSYTKVATQKTGVVAEDGQVIFTRKLKATGCFRFAWVNGSAVKFSAPFVVGVKPGVAAGFARKTVRRGSNACMIVRFNVPVTGRARFQYKLGRSWVTARSTSLRGARRAVICAKLNKAGKLKAQVALDGMPAFVPTVIPAGTITVRDMWRIIR